MKIKKALIQFGKILLILLSYSIIVLAAGHGVGVAAILVIGCFWVPGEAIHDPCFWGILALLISVFAAIHQRKVFSLGLEILGIILIYCSVIRVAWGGHNVLTITTSIPFYITSLVFIANDVVGCVRAERSSP